jgi:hypothetical protein
MGVFLRWGIFGILAVAGLVYAYNASKRVTQRHVAPPVALAAPAIAAPATSASVTAAASPQEEADAISERCRLELDIARRAVEARSIGEPLDRLLRIQEIAWQEDQKRRERLTLVATQWYGRSARVDPARLRNDVVTDCEKATP